MYNFIDPPWYSDPVEVTAWNAYIFNKENEEDNDEENKDED